MARIDVVDRIKAESASKNDLYSTLSFNFWALQCVRIAQIFSPEEIERLRKIATSLKLASKLSLKLREINRIMTLKGFRRLHSGTNRVVYGHSSDTSFVVKIAVDKIGMKDAPREYINQYYLQPFCCRVFEYAGDGVISFIERVDPITCIEEIESILMDFYNLNYKAIYCRGLIVEDLGIDKFKNYGIRKNADGSYWGIVVLDYPYVYKTDLSRLICKDCGGDIDMSDGLSYLYCTRCQRVHTAKELGDSITDINIDEIMRGGVMSFNGENKKFNNYNESLARARCVITHEDGSTEVIESSSIKGSKTYHQRKPKYAKYESEKVHLTEPVKCKVKKIIKIKPIKDNRKESDAIEFVNPYYKDWYDKFYPSAPENAIKTFRARSKKRKDKVAPTFAELVVDSYKDVGVDYNGKHYTTEEFVDMLWSLIEAGGES